MTVQFISKSVFRYTWHRVSLKFASEKKNFLKGRSTFYKFVSLPTLVSKQNPRSTTASPGHQNHPLFRGNETISVRCLLEGLLSEPLSGPLRGNSLQKSQPARAGGLSCSSFMQCVSRPIQQKINHLSELIHPMVLDAICTACATFALLHP